MTEKRSEGRGLRPEEIAVSVGLTIYARMVRLAHDQQQVAGDKNDYYVTLAQLESAFVALRDELGDRTNG